MPPRLPRGRPADEAQPDSVWHLLLHTVTGRALLAGAGTRLLASLVQLATGPSTIVNTIGAAGTLTLLAALSYLVWRVVAVARRRLLWRVRRKLILSYIFVGLVPVFLAIVFFALCGLFLFSSISSYVVQTRLKGVTEHAQFLARTMAIELAQVEDADDLADRLARKQRTVESRYPDASVALVPASRTCASDLPGRPTLPRLARPLVAGRWPHVVAPVALPAWIGCTGFAGLLVYAVDPPGGPAIAGPPDTRLFVRAVALPDGPSPTFAVVLDLPINQLMAVRLREETGIELGGVTVQRGGPEPMHGRSGATAGSRADLADASPGLGRQWVVFLDFTDWHSGRAGNLMQSIVMRIGDIYDRLSPSRFANGVSFGQALMFIILIVGLLFLIIQFVALVMGLALARSITGSVHELFVGTERVRQGDFSHQIPIRTRDQLGDLADSFNGMTARLGQLLAEMTEKKRLEEELRIARSIQMSLLPQRPPANLPGISLTGLCAPAREVGGDYYDFLPLGDRRLGLLIADVSGKGTSAAFYMAELKGLMLSLSQIHRSPRELLIEANRIITGNLDNRSFITMIYAVLDLDARTMTFARAGHTPLLHLPGGRDKRRARVLVPDGLVLGLTLDDGTTFNRLLEEVTIPLEPGDLFVFFTDGLSEQMNPGEDLFGEARLGALIEEHGDLPFDQLRERIVREVQAFAGGAAQHDDMTFILLRVDACDPVARPAPAEAEMVTT